MIADEAHRPIVEIERIQHGRADVAIRHGDRAYDATVLDLFSGLGGFISAVEQVLGRSLAGAGCRWEH